MVSYTTLSTSCNDDILPSGLGDLGNEGGCSRGLVGATRFPPKNKCRSIPIRLDHI